MQEETRDDVTSMGIIVKASTGIQTSQEQLGRKGTVMAVGPDCDPDLKVGDQILFGEFSFCEYLHEGRTKYLVMQDKDVVGVIE